MLAKSAGKILAESFAWNAGAASRDRLGGAGLRVVFTPDVDWVGVVIGLRPVGDGFGLGHVTRLTHGLYCSRGNAQPIEYGVLQGSAFAYSASDALTVDRANGEVTYQLNGTVKYTSTLAGAGYVHVEACLFGPEDSVS